MYNTSVIISLLHYLISAVDDLSDIYVELNKIKANYFQLGIVLGLPVEKLETIDQETLQNFDRAFTRMLLVWLRQDYNVTRHGPPTWRKLVEAVDGNNHALAMEIAEKHPLIGN